MIDLLTKERLLNWLYEQPLDKEFEFDSCTDCMIAQYLVSITGEKYILVGAHSFTLGKLNFDIPEELKIGNQVSGGSFTVKRALEILQ